MSFIGKLFSGGDKPAPEPKPVPKVSDESGATTDRERVRRVGRAALVATGSRGVLGNPTTARRQLLAV